MLYCNVLHSNMLVDYVLVHAVQHLIFLLSLVWLVQCFKEKRVSIKQRNTLFVHLSYQPENSDPDLSFLFCESLKFIKPILCYYLKISTWYDMRCFDAYTVDFTFPTSFVIFYMDGGWAVVKLDKLLMVLFTQMELVAYFFVKLTFAVSKVKRQFVAFVRFEWFLQALLH